MAHYWLVLINICLLLVIINIPFNSAQSYEVSRKTVYSNSGMRGTVICNYFPENEILPTSTSILGSLYPLRRFIRRNTRKSFFRTRKGLRGKTRKYKRGRGKNKLRSIYKSPFWRITLPKIPTIPLVDIPALLPSFSYLPNNSRARQSSSTSISKSNTFQGFNSIRNSNKRVSWSYNDGKTSIRINYSPVNTFISRKKASSKMMNSAVVGRKKNRLAG